MSTDKKLEKAILGERLKKARENIGLKQQEFAISLGYESYAPIKDMETGVTFLKKPIARLIEKIFGVSEEWLLTGEGPMRNLEAESGAITTTTKAGKNAVVTPIKGSGVKVNIKLNDQSAEQPQCDTFKFQLSEKEKIVVMLLRKIGEEPTIDNCIAKLKEVYEVKKW